MKLKQELREVRARWETLSLYEKFEQLVVSIISLLIAVIVAVATWQLVLNTVVLLRSHAVNPANYEVFQAVFGMIFTVLIALEFKHSLKVVLHHGDVVKAKSVVLIALLALVRKFIILDVYTATPGLIAALAGAVLALGVVYWLIREQDLEGNHQ
jgi:uncharacterized membrane protein (DUF373 family)